MNLSPESLFKDHYLLKRRIGEGGMGEVWEAVNQRTRLHVAIKVATTGGWRRKEASARFLRECYIGNILGKESGFIRVVDFDADDPTWMAMDLVEGAKPLGKDLSRPVSTWSELVGVLRQLREAALLTRRAHSVGVVHRDIKPGNILVDASGAVFLADFGLAKHAAMPAGLVTDDHATKTGTGFGTLAFMAPEQAKDAKGAGAPADVFALGATLFAILTASHPYGDSESEVIENHHDARNGRFKIPSLAGVCPWLPPELETLCHRALAVEPQDRPSMDEFVLSLERVLAVAAGRVDVAPARTSESEGGGGPSRLDPSAVFVNAADDHLATDVLFSEADVDSINEFAPAAGYKLYEWQAEALEAWEKAGRRGIVEAVTGAGKSLVGVEAVRRHMSTGGASALVVVPTRPLVKQWVRTFAALAPELRVGRFLGGTKDSFRTTDVIVATIQSLSGLSVPPGALLVADECHHYGGVEMIWDPKLRREVASPGVWTRAILGLPSKNRLGLTATVERADGGHDTALVDAVGSSVFTLSYARALRDSVVAPFKIAFIRCEFGDPTLEAEYHALDRRLGKLRKALVEGYKCAPDRFGQFLKDVQALAKGPARDGQNEAGEYLKKFARRREILGEVATKFDVVRSLVPCVSASDKALVFTESRKGGARAFEILDSAGVAVGYVDGSSGDRSALLSKFGRTVGRSGALKAIVSPKVLDEGVDVPAADLGIVVTASSTRRQMVQRLGRVIRKKSDGRTARFAVLVVKGTSEDPESGAHQDFISEVLEVLGHDKWRSFEAKDHAAYVAWLNEMRTVAAVQPARQGPAATEVPPDAGWRGLGGREWLQVTRAALVKEVVRRLVPAAMLRDIPTTDGKVHYIERICRFIPDPQQLRQALLKQPDLVEYLDAGVVLTAAPEATLPPDSPGDEIRTPRMVLAEHLVSSFSRSELLELARAGGVEGVSQKSVAAGIASAVASVGSGLGDLMSLDQIKRLARAIGAPVSGAKSDVFAVLAATVASQSDHFDFHVATMLTSAMTKDQLFYAGQRLEDEDIVLGWKKDAIAAELVRHPNGRCFEAFTAAELREMLGRWSLPRSGLKAELVARVALDLIDHTWEVGPD